MRYVAGFFLGLMVLVATVALSQSTTSPPAPNPNYTITSFPLFGALVTPSDTVPLTTPGQIRADADGAVTAVCVGNVLADDITLALVAGEFFPCVVSYVLDTGTDAITLHVFY